MPFNKSSSDVFLFVSDIDLHETFPYECFRK